MYEEQKERIITKLQLEKKNPKATIAALIDIFGKDHFNHSYEDKAGISDILLLQEEIDDNDGFEDQLCATLIMSEKDFEEQLGIRDSDSSIRENFRRGIISTKHTIGKTQLLAKRWAEKIKSGEFDDLPYTREYFILRYCTSRNPNLFTKEEILEKGAKTKSSEEKKIWIDSILAYDKEQGIKELIALNDFPRLSAHIPGLLDDLQPDHIKEIKEKYTKDDEQMVINLFLSKDASKNRS